MRHLAIAVALWACTGCAAGRIGPDCALTGIVLGQSRVSCSTPGPSEEEAQACLVRPGVHAEIAGGSFSSGFTGVLEALVATIVPLATAGVIP